MTMPYQKFKDVYELIKRYLSKLRNISPYRLRRFLHLSQTMHREAGWPKHEMGNPSDGSLPYPSKSRTIVYAVVFF